MDLKAFLQLSCQLVDKNKATVKIQGYIVTFETSKKGWQISTKLCSRGIVPLSLLGSIALARFSFFEKKGVFLKRNSADGSLYLMKKTCPLNTYEEFEKTLQTFIKFCDQWKGVIDEEHAFQDHFSLKEG